MSLTATISMSALDSWAARNTLRPIRPKPLIPTRTDMSRSLPCSLTERRGTLPRSASGHAVHVAVLDLDEEVRAIAELRGQVLGDRDRAVAPAGAADRHHEMRLALVDVLRQQVLEQRHHALVELDQPAVAADVVDDPLVEPRQRPQVGLVVRVREEAHVDREVGVARRAVLVAEGGEGDRE